MRASPRALAVASEQLPRAAEEFASQRRSRHRGALIAAGCAAACGAGRRWTSSRRALLRTGLALLGASSLGTAAGLVAADVAQRHGQRDALDGAEQDLARLRTIVRQ